MKKQECRNRVRCALSDSSGQLRVESFNIVDTPECQEMAEHLREYLVGKALAEVDAEHVRELARGAHPVCALEVSRLVRECQETFVSVDQADLKSARQNRPSADGTASG